MNQHFTSHYNAAFYGVLTVFVSMAAQIAFAKLLSVEVYYDLQIIIIVVNLLISYVGLWLILKYLLGGNLQSIGLHPIHSKTTIKWTTIGAFLFLIGTFISSAFEFLPITLGLGVQNDLLGLPEVSFRSPLISAIILGVTMPLWEELMFRGVIFNGLSRYPSIAVFASTALFALSHFGAIFSYFVTGLVFLFVYRRSGSLWAAIVTHVLIDVIGLTFLSII
jgi:membrane protease YdiL (CAAX protease family)